MGKIDREGQNANIEATFEWNFLGKLSTLDQFQPTRIIFDHCQIQLVITNDAQRSARNSLDSV